eukprot:TRINITY_DN22331_c0_g1_i1.p1 TRINITY_DN22331_c0_g1~~TRINITY_DN22331_c0_g1_i1.p1  ORF type:complete len:394 (+),score=150.01 TRINITY_DN22331_c0_g1_i1:221-1402(+)
MMGEGAEEIKSRLLSVWNSIKFGQTAWLLNGSSSSHPSSSPVCLLGQRYSSGDTFALDFASRLWLTYRREFQEFRGTRISSDCGWGCTIRSGQMLLGNALLRLHLGRSWRWRRENSRGQESTHRDIIRLFEDVEEAPLSIHSLLKIAGIILNRSPGEWFGPSSTSHLLKSAVNQGAASHNILKDLVVYIANDCTIYNSDVLELCGEPLSTWSPLLILIPLRLGGDRLNPIYVNCIKALLASEECVGIIGGRPRHSLYFVGFQDNYLIHLDPHLVQDRVDIKQNQNFDLKSFHCSTPKKMSVSKMDPSCCFGFLIEHRAHYERWKSQVMSSAVPEGLSYPMFTILDGKAADRTSQLEDLLSRSLILESSPADEEFVNVPRPKEELSISEDFVLI